jgi:hypothetical protein
VAASGGSLRLQRKQAFCLQEESGRSCHVYKETGAVACAYRENSGSSVTFTRRQRKQLISIERTASRKMVAAAVSPM